MSKEKKSVLQRVKHTLKSAADFITGDLPPECEAVMRKLREHHKQLEAQRRQSTRPKEATTDPVPRSQDTGICKKPDAESSQGNCARLSKRESRIASDVDTSRKSFPSQRPGVEESGDGCVQGRGGNVDLRSTTSETKPVPKLCRSQSSKEHRRPAAADDDLQMPRAARRTNRQSRQEGKSPASSSKVRRSDSDPHIAGEMHRFNSEIMSRNHAIDAALSDREFDLNPSKAAMLMSRLSLMNGFHFYDHDGVYGNDQYSSSDDPEYLDNCHLHSHRLRNVVDLDSTPEVLTNRTLPISMPGEYRSDITASRRHSMSLEDIQRCRDNVSRLPEGTESETFSALGLGRTSADLTRDTDVLKERFLRQTRCKSHKTTSQVQQQKGQLSASVLAREARAARKQMEKMIEAAERTLGDGQEFVSPTSRLVGGHAKRCSVYGEEADYDVQLRSTEGGTLKRPSRSASMVRPVSWTRQSPETLPGSKQVLSESRTGRRLLRDVDKERFWATVSNTAFRTTS